MCAILRFFFCFDVAWTIVLRCTSTQYHTSLYKLKIYDVVWNCTKATLGELRQIPASCTRLDEIGRDDPNAKANGVVWDIVCDVVHMDFHNLVHAIMWKIMIGWLTILRLAQEFFTYNLPGRDITIAVEGIKKLGLCSALRALEQAGILIFPHLLWHGSSVFQVSSEGPLHFIAFYVKLIR
jgi:hypothetical protein